MDFKSPGGQRQCFVRAMVVEVRRRCDKVPPEF